MTRLRNIGNPPTVNKTAESYLPPLAMKVTEVKTIQTYMTYLSRLSSMMNLKYTNIILDVGAAMPAYKTQWMYNDSFKNVIIHLGDFHFLKENFKVQLFLKSMFLTL